MGPDPEEARGFLLALRMWSPSSTASGGGCIAWRRPRRAVTCSGSADAEDAAAAEGASPRGGSSLSTSWLLAPDVGSELPGALGRGGLA